jgi:hypothetical protein
VPGDGRILRAKPQAPLNGLQFRRAVGCLTDVHLIGIHLTDIYLMGGYLMRMHLTSVSHSRVSHNSIFSWFSELYVYLRCLRSLATTILTTDRIQPFHSNVAAYSRLLVVAGLVSHFSFRHKVGALRTQGQGLKFLREWIGLDFCTSQ